MQLRRIVIIVGGVDAPVSILISVHKAEDWIRVDYLPGESRNVTLEIMTICEGSTDATLVTARQFESN